VPKRSKCCEFVMKPGSALPRHVCQHRLLLPKTFNPCFRDRLHLRTKFFSLVSETLAVCSAWLPISHQSSYCTSNASVSTGRALQQSPFLLPQEYLLLPPPTPRDSLLIAVIITAFVLKTACYRPKEAPPPNLWLHWNLTRLHSWPW